MIQLKTKQKIYQFLEKQSKNLNIDIVQIQLLLSFQNGKLTYYQCLNFQPKEIVLFKTILGMIDLIGIEIKANNFMINSLEYFAKKYGVDVESTNVFLIGKDSEVILIVYCNQNNVEQINLMDHFKNVEL